ncbi:MAG TPA: choice-of-anchor Q domain-containing protein, partial [Rhodanobacteraceae bacterium]
MVMPADTLTDDPLLLPLADNGGPTLTHALDPASIAIDTGSNPDNLDNDQRGPGYPRMTGAAPDIGAYEMPAPIVDRIFSSGFDP